VGHGLLDRKGVCAEQTWNFLLGSNVAIRRHWDVYLLFPKLGLPKRADVPLGRSQRLAFLFCLSDFRLIRLWVGGEFASYYVAHERPRSFRRSMRHAWVIDRP